MFVARPHIFRGPKHQLAWPMGESGSGYSSAVFKEVDELPQTTARYYKKLR